jgi:ABC-type multidrug transport system fused ATPase/permease subunit
MFQGGGIFGGPPGGGGGGGPGMARLRGAIDADDDDILGKVYDSRVFKRIPKFMAWVKWQIMFGAFGTIIRSVTTIAIPIVVQRATDDYMIHKNFSGLTIVSLIYVGISLLMWGGTYLETLYLSYAGQGILYKLRTGLFDHLHRLSLSFFDANKVGKVMSRVQNDVDQVQTLVTQDIISMIANIATLLMIAIIMISMNWKLALITLSVVPVLGIVIFIWQINARRAFIRVRRAIAVVNDQLQEGISGVRVTQSMSRESVNLKQFDEANKAHLDANVQAAKLQAFMMPIVEILTNIGFGIVLIYGGLQVAAGTATAGIVLAFLLYIQRFFAPVMETVMLYTELQRAMASAVRIFELLDIEPQIKDIPDAVEMPAVEGQIEFDHVNFAYNKETEILHDISFQIKAGETVAIAGRTGAGKSSLTSLIARFYDVTGGRILIDGYDIASVTQDSLRRNIAIVPQDPYLFSGTIEDNIKYGRLDAAHSEVEKAAEAAGTHDFISRLDHGYDTPVGERGGNLSAGQRQLVCLARAILANPRILILDEATSSVDTNTERIMQASLRKISEGRTCVIIAHRLSTVTNADRIIVLEHGKIAESGNHAELMARDGLYARMFNTLSATEQAGPSVN